MPGVELALEQALEPPARGHGRARSAALSRRTRGRFLESAADRARGAAGRYVTDSSRRASSWRVARPAAAARARGAPRRGGVRRRRVHALLGRALAVGPRARPGAAPNGSTGVQVLELGCGLGVPSLDGGSPRRARSRRSTGRPRRSSCSPERGAERARRRAVHADWRAFRGTFDLVLAADLLYEQRNVGPLLEVLPALRAGGPARRARAPARRRVLRAAPRRGAERSAGASGAAL